MPLALELLQPRKGRLKCNFIKVAKEQCVRFVWLPMYTQIGIWRYLEKFRAALDIFQYVSSLLVYNSL
jgi:hypothetical protein